MELLKTALIIALLTITSAKPASQRSTQGWLNRYHTWVSQSSESSSSDDSSESSESHSSEESSEEVFVTDETTPVMATTAGDGSTLTPEPPVRTDGTPVMETTPLPITVTTPVDVTTPCNVTQCFTEEIPTAAPITDNRGDN